MTTFLVIGIVGLVLVGVSLVLGDIFDGVFDVLAGDVFSSAVLGGFVSAFGFGAALMQGIGTPAVVSVPVGIAAGVVVGWLAWWLTKLVKDGSSDGTLTADDALGRSGRVITAIPAERLRRRPPDDRRPQRAAQREGGDAGRARHRGARDPDPLPHRGARRAGVEPVARRGGPLMLGVFRVRAAHGGGASAVVGLLRATTTQRCACSGGAKRQGLSPPGNCLPS